MIRFKNFLGKIFRRKATSQQPSAEVHAPNTIEHFEAFVLARNPNFPKEFGKAVRKAKRDDGIAMLKMAGDYFGHYRKAHPKPTDDTANLHFGYDSMLHLIKKYKNHK
jgi:hypothetical protein